jgi:hypothetical protein
MAEPKPDTAAHETAASIEILAVSLYESDCRERAGDMARRTTLSRIRAHYSFPAWTNLPARERGAWRTKARKMIGEARAWFADEAEWN